MGKSFAWGKPDWNFAMTRGWGRYVKAMLKIDNELTNRQPAWLDLNQDSGFIFTRESVWFFGKLSLISFTRATLCPKTVSNVGVRKTG